MGHRLLSVAPWNSQGRNGAAFTTNHRGSSQQNRLEIRWSEWMIAVDHAIVDRIREWDLLRDQTMKCSHPRHPVNPG